MFRISSLLLILALIMSTGCASIVSDSKYPVNITSIPEGATFKVLDRQGKTIAGGKTPGYISLKAGNGYFKKAKYKVIFEMDGYESTTSEVEAYLDGWYIANILFGGSDLLVGFLVIDPITGAMWQLDGTAHGELQPKE